MVSDIYFEGWQRRPEQKKRITALPLAPPAARGGGTCCHSNQLWLEKKSSSDHFFHY